MNGVCTLGKVSITLNFFFLFDKAYYRFSCHRCTESLTKHLRHSLPIKIPRASGAMTERRSRTDGQVRPDNEALDPTFCKWPSFDYSVALRVQYNVSFLHCDVLLLLQAV
ncbi:hypothetical protein NPIL_246011 [Nephila pilipes]|uniref:Uncharacterized protein n=1 Tax=Nephila pilipes TaxID=299642 RepID=A0A8X6JMI0_NEPPI|nr:hypothetical protein NPIL_246011 [Nephila pilipes]